MIIVDPVTLGDVACTRASPKWVFDRTGTLVQVPANTLAVTYDPADLSKAPYALIEAAASNYVLYSEGFTTGWSNNGAAITTGYGVAPDGAQNTTLVDGAGGGTRWHQILGLTIGANYTYSLFVRQGSAASVRLFRDGPASGRGATFNFADGSFSLLTDGLVGTGYQKLPNGVYRVWVAFWAPNTTNNMHLSPVGGTAEFWGAMVNDGIGPSSYIKTSGAQVARAADVIAPGAGLVYSNVPIAEAPYNVGTTYAQGAQVYDPVTYLTYQSAIAGNIGHALTDTASWLPLGTVVNRKKMLDQYNNTQTTNQDEILMVLSPQAISQGLYLGNLYADEVRISVVDKVERLVYSETKSLIESNSGSSFYNWFFKRIKRKDYFLTLKLPVYANALVTISLRKIGGAAKCGMCAIGPTDDFGPTLMGLSTEGKDYSSTTFNFDGTSSTVIRPYAKRMSCDVMVDNDQIDYLQARLFEIRQKPIVWVGGPYGSTAVYGRYESFKNVIQYATRSLMNLTIGGAV